MMNRPGQFDGVYPALTLRHRVRPQLVLSLVLPPIVWVNHHTRSKVFMNTRTKVRVIMNTRPKERVIMNTRTKERVFMNTNSFRL